MTENGSTASAVESRLDTMSSLITEYDGDLERLEREVEAIREEYRTEMAELRKRVSEVEDRTRLLQNVPTDAPKSREQRAAVVLQKLYQQAKTGTGNRDAFDARDIKVACNGEVKRAYAYDIMREVPKLVDDESVCWIIEEERHADRNTRVALDLSAGDVPASVEGVRIHNKGEPA